MSIVTEGGLEVKSIWSKAGVGTTVHVRGVGKQANILFDCGYLTDVHFAAKHVFISHGHIDHIGCCISHARGKGLGGKPANYYVPLHCVEPLRDAQRAFEVMDGKAIPMNIFPLQPFDVVEISNTYKVFAFPTQHRVPSQGYAIICSKKGALYPQYVDCTREEIIEMRKQKVRIHAEEEIVELVYSGDTTLQGLLEIPQIFNNFLSNSQSSIPCDSVSSCHLVLQNINIDFIFTSAILLLEMTYLDGDVEKALCRGHLHLNEFMRHGHMFSNKQIILMHISNKYSCQEIIDKLGRALSGNNLLRNKCAVGLYSFGDSEQIRTDIQGESNDNIMRY